MKVVNFLLPIFLTVLLIAACTTEPPPEPNYLEAPAGTSIIAASSQRDGDPDKGRDYLLYGDFEDSGIPYDLYLTVFGNDTENVLNRDGDNAVVNPVFTAVDAPNGVPKAEPPHRRRRHVARLLLSQPALVGGLCISRDNHYCRNLLNPFRRDE